MHCPEIGAADSQIDRGRRSSTDPHGHCEAQKAKALGIDGSLVAARIKLSSP